MQILEFLLVLVRCSMSKPDEQVLGPTLLIGKKQRFNINPSIIFSQVDRLSSPYETDHWYSETINNVPIYRAWKFGWGIGFSWNISTK